MSWEQGALLAKARLFVERGMEGDRDSALVPFWCSLSLELLARATLASVHPVLLADPQQGENILHAFGYEAKSPKSILAKTVFDRCQVVVERFTTADQDFCMSLMYLRNEELHTGAAAFENWPTSRWMVRFFRVSGVLLDHMGLDLTDFLPPSEVGPAQMMLLADAEAVRSDVLEAIGRARDLYAGLSEFEQESRRELADAGARDTGARLHLGAVCPACGNPAAVEGEPLRTTEPRLVDDLLKWTTVMLPTDLWCAACGLLLHGFDRMEAAGVGGQDTLEHWEDPASYYRDQAIEAFMEPDYGND
jgi:hypothetical protein